MIMLTQISLTSGEKVGTSLLGVKPLSVLKEAVCSASAPSCPAPGAALPT